MAADPPAAPPVEKKRPAEPAETKHARRATPPPAPPAALAAPAAPEPDRVVVMNGSKVTVTTFQGGSD
jgi:hypothetical protein